MEELNTTLDECEANTQASADEEAESWSDFLGRAGSCIHEAGIADEPSALFDSFQTTADLDLTFATFARLHFHATGSGSSSPPWSAPAEGQSWRFPYQLIQKLLGSNWKAKKLWKLLDDRSGRPEYLEASCSKGRLHGRRCLVVGAGPCGLRTAIELRLLGAEVVVAEQRTTFTRINQLHIWSWCGEDLKGLGARILEPPPKDFGSNPDLLVISISDLQKLLLKVALLLGVEVRMGLEYAGTNWLSGGWQASLRVASTVHGTEGRSGPEAMSSPAGGGVPYGASLSSNWGASVLPPSHFAPGVLQDVAVLVGSGGFASRVGDEVGMRMVETESLRRESAIGLICNVARTHGKSEADLRSFSLARQFYLALFKQVAAETGADLENIVYVKSAAAHYFVMTPTPKSLISTGVVIDDTHKPMLDRENIDSKKLDEFVRRVVGYKFKKDEPAVLEAVQKDLGNAIPGYADSGPRLFDFSKMRRSSDGLIFLTPTGVSGAEQPTDKDSLLVALAGDALLEPFWPEGLGIMRGFFGVLDACHAVREWSNGATCVATQEIYQNSFQQLKTLSAATRARVLRDDERKYALAPSSRYR